MTPKTKSLPTYVIFNTDMGQFAMVKFKSNLGNYENEVITNITTGNFPQLVQWLDGLRMCSVCFAEDYM